MPFAVGANIGPYRVIEQLGQGGMATVYKAYHAALDRYVALKVLHPAFGEDPNFEARFQREARLVAKLDHPNIVPVYDYSEHEKQPFLVMKFIEGETLKARMARGPLASGELTQIIESVGSALAYAHKMGILHRDIKPSNVLLTVDGSIYLADFGLARIASAGESTLSGDMIMGTPQYISPEQAMGKKELDEGTDIYSFGVMLYEMVVGQVPFNADTPFSIIHDHIYTPLPIPRKINPGVPESVERVLLKALSKERADRYAAVSEMTAAFKQAWLAAGVPMKGTTITMPPQPAPAPPKLDSVPTKMGAAPAAAEKKARKKRPRWMWVAGFFLLVVCCVFALIAVRRGGILPGEDQVATRQAATRTSIPIEPEQTSFIEPVPVRLIDDMEGKPPEWSSGWEGYFDENTATHVDCSLNSEFAHAGSNSIRFAFEVVPNSWATCGFYFRPNVNWGGGDGISFQMRADRAGILYNVDLYAGTPGALINHYVRMETTPESVENWVLVEIPWSKIRRAEWLENPGIPFDPTDVAGFSFGLSTEEETISGTIWLDDLSLLGSSDRPPDEAFTPEILESQRLVAENPEDPYAYLRLALAYFDAGQPHLSYEALNSAANLAGQDQAFFLNAAQRLTEREAWIAASAMYVRAIRSQPTGEFPPDLNVRFHEAVYKAAAAEELPIYLPFDTIAGVDQPMAYIAEGRHNLHRGENNLAREFLERARELKPSMPEVTLLEAEIFIKEGNRPDARQLLNNLMSSLETPDWIRALADSYLIQNR